MAKKKERVGSTVRDIRRKTRKKYSAEEKIRIVLEGLRGESTVAELCRHEGFAQIQIVKNRHTHSLAQPS